MNSADIALAAFTTCNSVRVFAYVPQLIKIGRDTEGAVAISYATWSMFALSHLSTVAYALVAVNDWKMAGVFAANTLCCSAILGLTAYKRRRAAHAQAHGGDTRQVATATRNPVGCATCPARDVAGACDLTYDCRRSLAC